MRWLRVLLAVIISFIPLANLYEPTSVFASDTANVTITATPTSGVAAPLNFTLTIISDTEIRIDWTKPPGVDKTMVRGKVGSYPADKTDGYQVYYDVAETTSDTGVNLDETTANIYYRAWSQDAGGIWSVNWAEANIGGRGVFVLAMIVLALGLMIAGYTLKKPVFAIASVGGWILLGAYAYTQHTTTWDTYYLLFWFAMMLVIVSALEAMTLVLRTPEQPKTTEQVEDKLDRLIKRQEKYQDRAEKYRRLMSADHEGQRRVKSGREIDEDTRLV